MLGSLGGFAWRSPARPGGWAGGPDSAAAFLRSGSGGRASAALQGLAAMVAPAQAFLLAVLLGPVEKVPRIPPAWLQNWPDSDM